MLRRGRMGFVPPTLVGQPPFAVARPWPRRPTTAAAGATPCCCAAIAAQRGAATAVDHSRLWVVPLGRRCYDDVLTLQLALHTARTQREKSRRLQQRSFDGTAPKDDGPIGGVAIPDVVFVVEHDPPVVTMGRRDTSAGVRAGGAADDGNGVAQGGAPPARTAFADGTAFRKIRRGGGLTWHGPGQVTVYPVVNVEATWRRAMAAVGPPPAAALGDAADQGGVTSIPEAESRSPLRWYVASLEVAMCRALAQVGILGSRRESVGVWLPRPTSEPAGATPRKIGFVGIDVDHWISMHGLCLNVLSSCVPAFDKIVMCECPGRQPTSVQCHLREQCEGHGRVVDIRSVGARVVPFPEGGERGGPSAAAVVEAMGLRVVEELMGQWGVVAAGNADSANGATGGPHHRTHTGWTYATERDVWRALSQACSLEAAPRTS